MLVAYSIRRLLLAGSVVLGPILAETGLAPAHAAPMQGPTFFEMLTSQTPLAELAPVPFPAADEQIHREIDDEICTAYRRWRASPGHDPRDHMETWCPTAN